MAKTASKNQNAPRHSEPKLSTSADTPAVKKKVLYLGISSARADRLHPGFKPDAWEWVRLDPDAGVRPDLQSHVTDLKGVEAGTFDAIWAPHLLHRLYPHVAEAMLQKAFRALKDEGMLALTVPDAQAAAIYFAHNRPNEVLYKSPAGEVTAHDVLYGYSKNLEKGLHQFAHRTGFTCESLSMALREAGFCSITVSADGFDLTAVAHRYDYDNPSRVEKVSIIYPKPGEKGRAKAPDLPQTQVQQQAPVVNNFQIDQLDQPPLIWKPLGLGLKP